MAEKRYGSGQGRDRRRDRDGDRNRDGDRDRGGDQDRGADRARGRGNRDGRDDRGRTGGSRPGPRDARGRGSGGRDSGGRDSGDRDGGGRDSAGRDQAARRPAAGSRGSGPRSGGGRSAAAGTGEGRAATGRSGPQRSGSQRSGSQRSGSQRSGSQRSGSQRSGSGRAGGSPYEGKRSGGSTFDSKRPAGRRPGQQAGADHRGRGPGDDHQERERRLPPGLEARHAEPPIPAGTDIRRLDRGVRAELRSLPKDLAEIVAGHLLLAGELIDEDPERAYAHAEAARRRAARLPIVREGAAETAYAAGKYDVALGEYRALRRMTGSADYLPVMADCERALGRPQQALRLVREAAGQPMEPASAVELRIIEAGARHDLGQTAEAARLLRAAIKDLGNRGTTAAMRLPAARLHYALADVLLDLGDPSGGYRELVAAAELDTEQETDAQERVDALDGLDIEFDDSEPGLDTGQDAGQDAEEGSGSAG